MAQFRYFNINPMGVEENDCVCRAISLATKNDYGFVYYLLYSNAIENGCDRLTKMCYRQILENKFDLRANNGNGRTVGEIADTYKNNRVIMRLQGHLTSSCYGTVYDLWNCLDKVVDEFWVIDYE